MSGIKSNDYIKLDQVYHTEKQVMVWNRMENGMEWNGYFSMEYGRCQNGMEWKISRMEWKTIFHTNSKLDFVHCIHRKIHTDAGW